MKNIIILLIVVQLTACTKELDQLPISVASVEGFYRDPDDFTQAVNGMYHTLKFYPNTLLRLSEIRSDNISLQTTADVMNNNISRFDLSLALNTYIEEAWNVDFRGIMKAAVLLDKLNEQVVPDETERKWFEAQAKYIRAMYYFDAVRWFGPLPLIVKATSPNEALLIGRSPVTDIYELIISDLQFAAETLPPTYPVNQTGYATSYAAKGLLALVHLTRSGPMLHPEGPCLGVNEYQQALTLLNEIIAGPYEFLDSYSSIFSFYNENNKEIVFAIQFKSGAGVGASFPTVLTGASWWNSVNLPFQGSGDRNSVSQQLLDLYGETDVRVGFNVVKEYTALGITYTDNPTCVKFASPDKNTWGVFRDDFGIDFPVLRFTDVLMMKAECILQGAPGSQQDVDDIVNMVRNRAGLDPLTNVTLDQLLEERRKEFLGEGSRWHDLIRTGKAVDVMNAWIPTVNYAGQITFPINADHLIYPVPQRQMDIKEGLYNQNKGYN